MKISLFKFPNLASLAFFLLVISTSCNKETDLVSEFVIKENSTNVIEQDNSGQLADIEESQIPN